jgi:hypothetical protein
MRIALLAMVGFLVGIPTVQAQPTFNKDVAPILFQQCASCHRPGEGAPFSLLTYADAKKRGKLIAQVTQSRQMPPWKADKGDVAFRNERRLKDADIAVVQQWFAAGMPEGDAKDLPRPPAFASEWPLGKPDLVVKMPKAYRVPAEGRDIYRNFAIALGLKEDKWVKAIDFRPSAPSVVHHSLFFLDTTGTAAKREADSGQVGSAGAMGGIGKLGGKDKAGDLFAKLRDPSALANGTLGGWAVGAQARALPDGLAYKLPKGADLILSTHFHPSGKAEDEASTIAFYFADKPPVHRFTGIQLPFLFGIGAGINIAPGQKDFAIEDAFVLPIDVKAFGISAHRQELQGDGHAARRQGENAVAHSGLGLHLARAVSLPGLRRAAQGHQAARQNQLRQLRGKSAQPDEPAEARQMGKGIHRRNGQHHAAGGRGRRKSVFAPARRLSAAPGEWAAEKNRQEAMSMEVLGPTKMGNGRWIMVNG